MLEIKVTVNCPELAELADAIRGRCAAPGVPAAPAAPTALTPPPAAPVVPVTPVSAPVTTPAPVSAPTMPAPSAPVSAPAAPVAAPAPTAAPVAAPAPTAAPSYTSEQLAKVGADLVQAGKMPQLLALLAQYGVQAVTQLPPEQYGPFALALRGLGGNI